MELRFTTTRRGVENEHNILAFDAAEKELFEYLVSSLRSRGAIEAERIARRLKDVEGLASAISRFPSIRESQLTGGTESLIGALCRGVGSARMMRMPTRVVATRSFLIAKIHAFSMAAMEAEPDRDLAHRFNSAAYAVVFSLMAEDVYIDCLDNPALPQEQKRALASDLVKLWDLGRDPRATEHVPALTSLWAAREVTPPSFGTMEGSSELIRLSIDLGFDWCSFVAECIGDMETLSALEEFLFGLSYEEIHKIRKRLSSLEVCTIGREDVRSLLGQIGAYTPLIVNEPKTMYEFYSERREAAHIRKSASLPGPVRTIEEIYLSHRMMTIGR